MAFNEPVTASISFRGFRHRGMLNPDGWGLAWFTDRSKAKVRKEARAAHTSNNASYLRKEEVYSSLLIGHVRLASHGARSLANTHPFQRILRGIDVVFAHNGTLTRLPQPPRSKPEGETDSEMVFCLLLDRMKEESVDFSNFQKIEEMIRELNKYGTMNLLFSDGHRLFAYRDLAGYKGLCFTYRRSPFPTIMLVDEDWNVNLAEKKKPSEKGFVIATRALTNERWRDFRKGRLFVIQGGEAIYGDHCA